MTTLFRDLEEAPCRESLTPARLHELYEFSSPVDLRSSSLGIRFRRGTERTFDRTICLDRSAKGRGQFVRSSSPIQPGDPSSSFRNRVVRGSRFRVRKFGTSGRFEERIFVASYRRFLSRLQSPLFPFGILRRITNSKLPSNDPHPSRIGLLNRASAIMIRPKEVNRRNVALIPKKTKGKRSGVTNARTNRHLTRCY